MKNLTVKLSSYSKKDRLFVKIDGNEVPLKRNEFKNLEGVYQTEKSVARVEVVKYLNIGGFFWFITEMFFFLISVFGIFYSRVKNRYKAIVYTAVVNFENTAEINLFVNNPKTSSAAISCSSKNAKVTEINNEYYDDKKAKKLTKILGLSKFLLFLFVAVLTIVLIVIR